MPTIIWEGNQEWNKDFSDMPIPERAVRINRPDDILKSSLPYGIIPLAICFVFVFIKKNASDVFLFDLRFMPIGFLIGFLLIPAHEFLHAICYPKDATVYVGICLKKLAAYAVSPDAISKRRYIVMSLAPVLLGVIPLVVFVLTPLSQKALLTISVVPAFMGLISPSPDYMDVLHIAVQVPKGSKIQASNQGLFWFQ